MVPAFLAILLDDSQEIIEIVATRCPILMLKCAKFNLGDLGHSPTLNYLQRSWREEKDGDGTGRGGKWLWASASLNLCAVRFASVNQGKMYFVRRFNQNAAVD